MNVEYINPFVESVYDLFKTMIGIEVERGALGLLKDGDSAARDVTGLIGMSGRVRGTVAIAFPSKTAIAIVNRLLSLEETEVGDMVKDGVAELVNIVAGNAKAKLANENLPPIDLGLPIVVQGQNYTVDYPSGTRWLEVPFNSELGAMMLRVTLKEYEK